MSYQNEKPQKDQGRESHPVTVTVVHQRSLKEILEGMKPFGIKFEDRETGDAFTAEGNTEQEARDNLALMQKRARN